MHLKVMPHIPALFLTSLMQIVGHKISALMVIFSKFQTFFHKIKSNQQDQKYGEKLLKKTPL